MKGHTEDGNFHPHQDKPGIHSGTVNSSTKIKDWHGNTGTVKSGKVLQNESRCTRCGTQDLPCNCNIHDGNNLENMVDKLDPKEHETPEQIYNRVEPIIKELENNIPDMAQNYLSDLLNDLEEPNAKPGEYDDGAKIDNYEQTLRMVKENLS